MKMQWPDLDSLPQNEMVSRVRQLDWSQTPLGPPEQWSPALRLACAMILASGFPMAIRWGPDLVSIYNDAYRPILGGKHPAALGRPMREVWSEIRDELGPLNEAILCGAHPAYFAVDQRWRVERGVTPEEARFTISYSPIPDQSAPHGIGGVLVTCVETTDRVQTEAELRALNETLEAQVAQRTLERDRIWQVSEDLLGVSSFDGYFLSVNPAWTRLLGWSDEEIKRIHVNELRHPEDAAHSIAGRARLAAGVPTVRMENRFRHKDRSWRWIYWTMTAEQGLIYVIGRHVTAEKEAAEALRRAEEQLAQSQKMEALGQLTGGIAHDFNNLLMVVSANAQTLKARLSEGRDRRAAEAIELVAQRGENLTRQLLSFSRRQALNPVVVDLGRHVPGLSDLLASSARGDIALSIDIPPQTWPVAVDVPEFELALVNLVVNARDAIAESGAITIEAGNAQLRPEDTPDGVAGEFVALAVSDTGCGIADELQSKVFEPFFTTKGIGKGTGLGLSQVYGFTRQSGGTVTIRSRTGAGTIVTLYLPRSAAPAAEQVEAPSPVEAARPGERVLLVEDNAEVREVAAMLLAELGYEVVEADGAAAALRLLAEDRRIDLMMTDIVMPGEMNGLGLAQLVRDAHPRTAVLLTTGYAAAAGAVAGFPMLRKPYPMARLARAVRDALTATRTE